jgi:flagellar hook-associated protein 2
MANITSAIGAGMGSGIDINAVIEATMAAERRPIDVLSRKQSATKAQLAAVSSIKSKLDAMRSATSGLSEISSVLKYTGTTSDDTIASVKAAGSKVDAATLSFKVTSVASTHILRSTGTSLSRTGSAGATTESFLDVVKGTESLGIKSSKASSGATVADLEIAVTRASVAAAVTGGAVGTSNVINGSNDSMTLTIGGTTTTVTVAHGTYDRAGLVSAVDTALASAGAKAEISGTSIKISSKAEGSSATLSLVSGSVLAHLGHSATGVLNGSDGSVRINGTDAVVSTASDGATVSVGDHTLTLSGGLRVGSAKGKTVSTGTGSIDAVVAAINNASVGVKAAAVSVGSGAWRLQIQSSSSGLSGNVGIDGESFDSLSGMAVAATASDAKITIGSGPGAYSISDSDGVFTGVADGWSITAKKASDSIVTLSVAPDAQGAASAIEAAVKSVNEAIAELKKQTAVGSKGASSGPLSSDATMRSLLSSVRNSLAASVGKSVPGLSFSRDGTAAFDSAKFQASYNDSVTTATSGVGRSGSSSNESTAIYAAAQAVTYAGTYAVAITTQASRAESSTQFVGGSVSDKLVSVKVGTTEALYQVKSGDSASDVATGLSAALSSAGLQLETQLVGGGLRVVAQDYGSTSSFSVNWDLAGSGTLTTHAGTDVAGTIDGSIASGVGQFLSLPSDAASLARGLRVTALGSASSSANITYTPGVMGASTALLSRVFQTITGTLAIAESSRQTRISTMNKQIDALENRMTQKESSLRRQYASLDSMLGGLKSQQSWLTNQISSMNRSNE